MACGCTVTQHNLTVAGRQESFIAHQDDNCAGAGADFHRAGLDLQLEVMWALTDFTEQNGATHAVLGSHREEPRGGRLGYKQGPGIQAFMPKGSALIWTGWSVHGAGANHSPSQRAGVNINYSLSFLAQEVRCPPPLS